MDMLRLCRGDNMGIRDVVPAMFLRLGQDQKCYDFVNWWQTTGQEGDYEWGDMSLPYLDVVGADAFEPVEYMCKSKWLDLSHNVAIALLKIKMLLDLQSLEKSRILKKKFPTEIVNNIQRYLPRSAIISENKDIMNRADYAPYIRKLIAQIQILYKAIEKANEYFWDVLLDPEQHIHARPEAYTHGSLAQARLVLKYSLSSWEELPEALAAIWLIREESHKLPEAGF